MNERICRSAEPRLLGTPSNEGEERRRLVLERKAQHDLEKHEKLLQKLGQVEDRRQAVMEQRRKKALESANKLNERIAQANAKRRQQEEQNRMKKESAIKKTEESHERAAVIKRRNTIPRSFSMHVSANKDNKQQNPSTQVNNDKVAPVPTLKVPHFPRRIKAGQTSAHDTSGSDSDSGKLMRSRSARFASAVTLSSPKATSTPRRPEFNRPMSGSGNVTIFRSKSTRVISNRKSSPDTNSTSENSSARTSVENKVKFSSIATQENKVKFSSIATQDSNKVFSNSKASSSGPSPAGVRRSQSNPARRIENRKVIEPKPMSPLITQTRKPSASSSKLAPDVKANTPRKASADSTTATAESQQPLPEKKFDAAEEEFKKKLAERRRLAREKQNQKTEKMSGLMTVVSMPNVASNDVSEKDTTDDSFSIEETVAGPEVAAETVEKLPLQKPEPEVVPESEKEKDARKQREREEAVALRMKKMEEEREKARLKEAEDNAKLENEERERERLLKEAELERQRKQEEEERAARKAKLEAIMARTRAGGGASVTRALAASGLDPHKRREEERVTDSDVTSSSKQSMHPEPEQSSAHQVDSTQSTPRLDSHIIASTTVNVELSSVEHDSPTSSKVPSPGVDNLSPVGGRHAVSLESESTGLDDKTVFADPNFEQVIVLPSEERGSAYNEVGSQGDMVTEQGANSNESDERDVIMSKTSDENASPVMNFANPVSHENDNVEHTQFQF